jgi:hypothetical protein
VLFGRSHNQIAHVGENSAAVASRSESATARCAGFVLGKSRSDLRVAIEPIVVSQLYLAWTWSCWRNALFHIYSLVENEVFQFWL